MKPLNIRRSRFAAFAVLLAVAITWGGCMTILPNGSVTYTLVLTEQNIGGQNPTFSVFPPDSETWPIHTGDTILLVNLTEFKATVTANPPVYLGQKNSTIVIGPGNAAVAAIIGSPSDKTEFLTFTWTLPQPDGEPHVVTGGPKMKPVDPTR